MLSWRQIVEWLFWLFVGWWALLGSVGCSANVANLTDEDIDRISKLSEIAQSWGPEGSLRIRAGRPFLAGLFEGILVIPGVEIDMDASTDPARTPPGKPKGNVAAAQGGDDDVSLSPSRTKSIAPLDPTAEYAVIVTRGRVEERLLFRGDELIQTD